MEQTFKFPISYIDNQESLNSMIFNYTGLFYKLFNNMEFIEDKGFIKECQEKFNIDRSTYDNCLTDVKTPI